MVVCHDDCKKQNASSLLYLFTKDEDKKKEKQKEQEELEKQEKEKERLRLAENNNIGEIHKEQDKVTASDSLDLKNNKEKGRLNVKESCMADE